MSKIDNRVQSRINKILLFGCALFMVSSIGSTTIASAAAAPVKESDEAVFLFKELSDKLHHITAQSVAKMDIPADKILGTLCDQCDRIAINSYLVCIGLRPAYLFQMVYTDIEYQLEEMEGLSEEEKQEFLKSIELLSKIFALKEELTSCIKTSGLYVTNANKSSDFISKGPLPAKATENDLMENVDEILGYPYKMPSSKEHCISIKFNLESVDKRQPFLVVLCARDKKDQMINEKMRAEFEHGLQKINPEWKVILEEENIYPEVVDDISVAESEIDLASSAVPADEDHAALELAADLDKIDISKQD